MANGDAKVWNLANVIITIMATVIAVIIGFGLNSITSKIEQGDASIYARMGEIKAEIKGMNDCMMRMQSDITRLDTLQKMRLEKEAREENRKKGYSQ
jgi:hypothetical protein